MLISRIHAQLHARTNLFTYPQRVARFMQTGAVLALRAIVLSLPVRSHRPALAAARDRCAPLIDPVLSKV